MLCIHCIVCRSWCVLCRMGHTTSGIMARECMLIKLLLIPTWTCNGPTGCHWCHQFPLPVPWTPYGVGLCLLAPCTHLTRSLYPQGWILKAPPCWRCWRPWWWSRSPYQSWRSPRWVEEALMTHSVVIYALTVSWYPRRRPIYPTSDGTMDFGPWRPHGVAHVCGALDVWMETLIWLMMTLIPLVEFVAIGMLWNPCTCPPYDEEALESLEEALKKCFYPQAL